RFANACRASVGAPDEVSRSTTVRGVNNSHVFLAFLFTMRAVIGFTHWNLALGSKKVHWRHVWSSTRQFGQELSKLIFVGALAPHAAHFTFSPNPLIVGERGPSRSLARAWGGLHCDFDRCGSRSFSM